MAPRRWSEPEYFAIQRITIFVQLEDANMSKNGAVQRCLYGMGRIEKKNKTGRNCISIEDKVSKRDYPICLFRNLVRRKEAQANILRTGQSTFITALRSKKALIDLQALLQSTKKVQGKLFASSAYSNPFHPICLNCNLPAENFGSIQGKMLYCSKCEVETNFIYSHRLKCNIINTEGAKVPCTLKSDLLKTVLPALTDVSYEDYLTDKSVMIYLIRDFSFEGVFVLDQDDVIVDLRGQLIE